MSTVLREMYWEFIPSRACLACLVRFRVPQGAPGLLRLWRRRGGKNLDGTYTALLYLYSYEQSGYYYVHSRRRQGGRPSTPTTG